MYDISKLKTVEDCRTVMDRAKARGLDDVYQEVFRRYCEIVGHDYEDPSDPLIKDFYETLAAYEQLLTEKNGSTTKATRTRQKLANKGVYQSIVDWANASVATNGFTLLVESGLADMTTEYLVVKHRARFNDEVVERAKKRLGDADIEFPVG